jgi:hypothetical protein
MKLLIEIAVTLAMFMNSSVSANVTKHVENSAKAPYESIVKLTERSIRLANDSVITRKLVFDNLTIDVSDKTVGSLYVNGSGRIIQSYIDQGIVAQAWNPLDNNDGKVTYLAGHNPGVFSGLASIIHIGQTFSVYDSFGNKKEYKFVNMYETPMDVARSGVDINVRTYCYYHMYDHEGIVIQFCRAERGIMQFWIADPI